MICGASTRLQGWDHRLSAVGAPAFRPVNRGAK